MNQSNIIPPYLTESVALVPLYCSNCLDEIDIGDDCYIDSSAGVTEDKAKVFCRYCYEGRN